MKIHQPEKYRMQGTIKSKTRSMKTRRTDQTNNKKENKRITRIKD